MSRESVEATTLAAELAQAVADLVHLRQLVSERKASGAELCVAEYRVTGLRRRVADHPATDHRQPTTGNRPPATDHRQPTTGNRPPATGGGRGSPRDIA